MSQLKSLAKLFLLIAFAIGKVHAADVPNDDSAIDVEGAHHEIDIRDFAFIPLSLSIKLGDKITWTNSDIVPHRATAVDGSWDSGLRKTGESYSLVVMEGMNFNYYCVFHPAMVATLKWGS